MPKQYTKRTLQIAAELDAELVAEFRAFVEKRGEKVRRHLEVAIRRHLDNPPPPFEPPPPPPLPPVPGSVGPAKKPRKGAKS